MKNKKIRLLFLIPVILLILWGTMATTDYILSRKAEPPIFAVASHVTDADRYLGIGYRIIIHYEGPIGFPGEELQGDFYWGWD